MIKKQLINRIDKILDELHFQRKGSSWVRSYQNIKDLIDIQIDKSKDLFTINGGVADKFTVETCWDIGDWINISEPSCVVRSRLGLLINGHDTWWNLSDPHDISYVEDHIRTILVPFLNEHHSIDSMINHLSSLAGNKYHPLESIYSAILNFRIGNLDKSAELLGMVSRSISDSWSKKALKVANKLELSL